MALKMSELTEDFFRQLAREYLQYGQTMSGLAKKHESSPGTISNILFTGVVNSIIDEVTATAIVEKVVRKTRPYEKMKTRNHWEKALKLREIQATEHELEFLRQKLDELSFKLATYDEYFYDDEAAPSKQSIWREMGDVQHDIHILEEFLRGANNE